MIKLLLFLFISQLFLLANTKIETYKLYKDKQYEAACTSGEQLLQQYKTDEEFLSLYAFSCLNSDHIDKLSLPISMLKSTPDSRANAAYLSVIVMQKNLLMHALVDQYDLQPIKLPTTEHVLSIVFDLYTNDTGSKERRRYNYIDQKDSKKSYRLFVTKSGSTPKIIIEEYYDKVMTIRHIYW